MISLSPAPFRAWTLLGFVYDHAYQVGASGRYLDENAMRLNFMLDGFAKVDASGQIFSPCRRVLAVSSAA